MWFRSLVKRIKKKAIDNKIKHVYNSASFDKEERFKTDDVLNN
jgi:hypothetical protein